MSTYKNLDEFWPDLSDLLKKLLTFETTGITNKEWMNRVTDVYNYCSQAPPTGSLSSSNENEMIGKRGVRSGLEFGGAELHSKVLELFTEHIKELKVSILKHREESLVTIYRKEWDTFNDAVRYIKHLLNYLDKNYVNKQRSLGKPVPTISTFAFQLWKNEVFNEVQIHITNILLSLIQRERNGETINSTLITTIINSLIVLGSNDFTGTATLAVYSKFFEQRFFESTSEYYAQESAKFISENSVTDYLRKVEQRLEEEDQRCTNYLHSDTRGRLIKICEETMISKHKETIHPEFKRLLEEEKNEDAKRLFLLLNRVHKGTEPLIKIFEDFCLQTGIETIRSISQRIVTELNTGSQQAEKAAEEFTSTLIRIVGRLHSFLNVCCDNKLEFQQALDRAARKFINENEVCKLCKSAKTSELLAKFSDSLLKKGAKVAEDQNIEKLLDDVLNVFSRIEDKDVFMIFYSKQLAKRLIFANSASEDNEAYMLNKLRTIGGYEFTAKIQRMLNDVQINKQLNTDYKTYCDENKLKLVDLTVQILTTGSWPISPSSANLAVPEQISQALDSFAAFYSRKFQSRKLNWLHQYSKGDIKWDFSLAVKTGYLLQVTATQCSILSVFSNHPSATVAQLLELTQISDQILISILNTFVKIKLLVTEPTDAKDISRATVILPNKAFKNQRVKINLSGLRVEAEEKKEQVATQKEVDDSRKWQIQAAIVRIMKTRKQLRHQGLMSEVVAQLQSRFKPQIPLIKKCIDSLIEKEYLKRVEGEKDLYQYLA
eukprot:TRINITY_DN215_c0_g5_i1.p1 TRINITY_DN215_c0_g5~~TRINITY_DN215_c0_g5_i1.p1  ORF type:complete len:775 (-),score=366.16 TRINITY_DN215_c0_g5_i1:24-2348(-)